MNGTNHVHVHAMDIAEESKPFEDAKPSSPTEKYNPVLDDGLLSLLQQDFAKSDVVEEKSGPCPVSDAGNDGGNIEAPQLAKRPEKSYECPHCDFVATGGDNMKLYEEAVKHKKSSHKEQDVVEFTCQICQYRAKDKSSLTRHRKIHKLKS